MPVMKLFSSRRKEAEKAGKLDVYQYGAPPPELRVQMQHIFADAIGGFGSSYSANNNQAWNFIQKTLCKEKGVHFLSGRQVDYAGHDVLNYIGNASSADDFLDAVELCARYVDLVMRDIPEYNHGNLGVSQTSSDAIDEINQRFRMAGLGYQYVDGQVIRVDSQFIHAEVVLPALEVLSAAGFEGPRKEFMEAHRHLREGSDKDAIVWAGKAFESTMKAICEKKKWVYPKGARASDLLKILRDKRLWPEYLDASFDQLAATLKSGLPQIRNEEGAHGDGILPKKTPRYIASYALHLAAAKILLMAEAAGVR